MTMPENGETLEPQGPQEGGEQPTTGGRAAGGGGERRANIFSRALEGARSFLRREGNQQTDAGQQAESAAPTGGAQTAEDRLELDRQLFSSIRRLIQLRSRVPDQYNEEGGDQLLGALTNTFKQRVEEIKNFPENGSYREIYEFVKHVKGWEDVAKIDLDWQADLDALLSETDREALLVKQKEVDAFFQREYDKMDDSVRETIFGDLERELKNGIDGLRLGQTIHDIETMMFGGLDRYGREVRPEVAAVGRGLHKEPAVVSGILEWRATKSIEGVETQVGIDLLTQPPARWQEVPQKLANIYKFIESTDFTVEQLSSSVQKAVNMIETVQRNSPEGRKMLAQLNKELKAFQAFHMFRVTLERGNQNPDKALGVFENYFDNETWKNFAERFGKDNRGREFMATKDKEGNSIEQEINLFDLAEKAYFRKLQQERRTMNLIEAMTAVGINNKFEWREWGAMEILLRRALKPEERTELESLRLTFKDGEKVEVKDKDGNVVLDENGQPKTEIKYKIGNVDDWGKDIGKTKDVIREWYKGKTLLGAVGKLGERRQEMRDALKEELKARGLGIKSTSDNTVTKLDEGALEALDNSGYLESVDYNAYYFLWTMGWSDFDIIRVYGKEQAGKKNPMIRAIAYNESSFNFHGRIVDHSWEFFVDEKRGREDKEYDPNEVIRRVFPGRHHGLFQRNRTLVRFFDSFVSDEQRKKLGVDEKIKKMMKDEDLQDYDKREEDYFRSWVEGIVIGDLIDNGEVDFADKDFSKKTIGENAQYLMGDLYTDRGLTVKYLNKEGFQMYLADPTTENFRKINKKISAFYSGRNIRLWPWMTLASRGHWEFNSKHALRVYRRPNMTAAEGEKFIDELIDDGDMEKKQGTVEKRRNFGFYKIGGRIKIGEWVITEKEYTLKLGKFFGTLPFRKVRQELESYRRLGWDARWLLLAMLGAGIVAYLKQWPKEMRESFGRS